MRFKLIIASVFSAFFLSASILPEVNPVTGPSHAEVKIKPVAFSENGVVLCLTEHSLNPMGAHDLMDTEFGYLAVSKNGIWEEKVVKIIYNLDGFDSLEKFKSRFYQPIDFKNPPAYLNEIIQKHKIQFTTYTENPNLYFWTTQGLSDGKDKLLLKNIRQKSIKGYKSKMGSGTRTGNTIEIQGVIFFENYQTFNYFNDEMIEVGGVFLDDLFDYPFEIFNVTGIVLLKD